MRTSNRRRSGRCLDVARQVLVQDRVDYLGTFVGVHFDKRTIRRRFRTGRPRRRRKPLLADNPVATRCEERGRRPGRLEAMSRCPFPSENLTSLAFMVVSFRASHFTTTLIFVVMSTVEGARSSSVPRAGKWNRKVPSLRRGGR